MTGSKNKQAPLFNIANVLTVIRLVLVPVFFCLVWTDSDPRRWWGWAVFAVAAFTDKLDGYLARSRNLITDFGKLADSIADKALIIAALLLLSVHGYLWWWVTVVFIVRELGITAMRMNMRHIKVMAAGRGGKVKMFAQSMGIAGLLIPWHTVFPSSVAAALVYISYACIAIGLYYALSSAYEYVNEAVNLIRAAKKR